MIGNEAPVAVEFDEDCELPLLVKRAMESDVGSEAPVTLELDQEDIWAAASKSVKKRLFLVEELPKGQWTPRSGVAN